MKKSVSLILCLVLLISCAFAQSIDGQTCCEELASLLDSAPEKLLQAKTLVAGDSISDWTALIAARNGYNENANAYLQDLWDYVSQKYQEQGGLDTIQATVWHRISLTVLALGADPTCFGEDAQGDPIDLIADGTYHWSTTDSLGIQGTNAWIYALLVLDAGNYEVPEDGLYTRETIIEAILNAQLEDGGFHFANGASEVDMTAMALQALAPYADTNEAVKQSVEQALEYLSAIQNAQGDFGSGGSESCSQVILALCALGIDPETDPRFTKAGGTALNGLLLYHVSGGGFSHLLGDDADTLATVQAAQALTALDRLRAGEGRLYDFTDLQIEAYVPQADLPIGLICAAALAAAAIIIVCIWKGKKACTR